jgi:AhpD family alkylhydroperoxidase
MDAKMSRFKIHDDETAPAGSVPLLKAAVSTAGQLPNFLGVLASSPAVLRGYARFRNELRQGVLAPATVERIALAVAKSHGSEPGLALHERTARANGLGLDEVVRAERWTSADPKEAALLAWLKASARSDVPRHLHETAVEAGWTDAELLEAMAVLALETFTALINVAGDVPVDGSTEETRQLRAVA